MSSLTLQSSFHLVRGKVSRSYHTLNGSISIHYQSKTKRESPQQGERETERELLQVLHVLIHLPGSVAAVKALSERDGCNLIKKNKENCFYLVSMK